MSVRQRKSAKGAASPPPEGQLDSKYNSAVSKDESKGNPPSVAEKHSTLVVLALAALAFFTRTYKIWHPDQVVFDEVHFGKFAAYYIKRSYYFDVHPPLAKLMLGFAGWLVGFDGSFEFEDIGNDYSKAGVPYVGMRMLPAILGSLTVPVVWGIMRESGYPAAVAAFSAALVLFDNAHIAQTRLILLDAPLVLFMSLSIYSYIRFHKLRYREFTREWWTWLFLTGLFLALTLSCKMVGLLTFLTIGTAVLVDLWNLLDIRRGLGMDHVARHFFARALGLIVFPLTVYLFWFWVHFAILTKTGPGDAFMSPEFQETLEGSALLMNSQEIRYYDNMTLCHKDTKVFLHSHLERYPLTYEDGRVSSKGQQVTGYPHNDTNNHWQVVPTRPLPEDNLSDEYVVKHKDVVRLLHVNTQSYLLAHDVASPLMATNEEFTTWPRDDDTRYDDTLFELQINNAEEDDPWMTKSSWFRLIHVSTGVAMWTHPDPLPDWGFQQQEVNGIKNAKEKTAVWYVDELFFDPDTPDPLNRTKPGEPKPVKPLGFLTKFLELQMLMLQHNAGLTASHPYASEPINWPFLLSGISFWTSGKKKEQIYLIGNIASWWLSIMSISVFVGVLGADAFARRRGVQPIEDSIRNRLYNSAGFFLVAWLCHYLPFFLMNRQRFLHHYLPAHVCSALVAGAVFNFIVTESINYPVSIPGPLLTRDRLRPKTFTDIGRRGKMATGLVIAVIMLSFFYFSPLTYGTPELTAAEVNARRVLSSWTLHFSK